MAEAKDTGMRLQCRSGNYSQTSKTVSIKDSQFQKMAMENGTLAPTCSTESHSIDEIRGHLSRRPKSLEPSETAYREYLVDVESLNPKVVQRSLEVRLQLGGAHQRLELKRRKQGREGVEYFAHGSKA